MNGEPYVIEYNVRMGDPETQAVLPRIDGDLVEALVACAQGRIKEANSLNFSSSKAATVVLASQGYPDKYEKGSPITNINHENALVFHAATKTQDDTLISNGGRVLAITCLDKDPLQARQAAYEVCSKIEWKDKYYRLDIGRDILS